MIWSNTHDLVGVGEKNKSKTKQNKQQQLYASLCHTDAARTRTKAEWGEIVQHSCFLQAEKKWSGRAILLSAFILSDLSIWGGGGGGGTSSMRQVQLLVLLSSNGFTCWSTPEVILFSWRFPLHLDLVYRVSPASHTKHSVSAGTWYQRLYFSLVPGKHLLVKTGICRSSRGSEVWVPAEFSFPLSTFCADSHLGIPSTPVLPQ